MAIVLGPASTASAAALRRALRALQPAAPPSQASGVRIIPMHAHYTVQCPQGIVTGRLSHQAPAPADPCGAGPAASATTPTPSTRPASP